MHGDRAPGSFRGCRRGPPGLSLPRTVRRRALRARRLRWLQGVAAAALGDQSVPARPHQHEEKKNEPAVDRNEKAAQSSAQATGENKSLSGTMDLERKESIQGAMDEKSQVDLKPEAAKEKRSNDTTYSIKMVREYVDLRADLDLLPVPIPPVSSCLALLDGECEEVFGGLVRWKGGKIMVSYNAQLELRRRLVEAALTLDCGHTLTNEKTVGELTKYLDEQGLHSGGRIYELVRHLCRTTTASELGNAAAAVPAGQDRGGRHRGAAPVPRGATPRRGHAKGGKPAGEGGRGRGRGRPYRRDWAG